MKGKKEQVKIEVSSPGRDPPWGRSRALQSFLETSLIKRKQLLARSSERRIRRLIFSLYRTLYDYYKSYGFTFLVAT